MPPSDRKFRVPHDLAHVAVERDLGQADGVSGTVMAGGLFDKPRIVAGGRRRHDDRQRGAALARATAPPTPWPLPRCWPVTCTRPSKPAP
ncbi:MAG: hypothetical protein M3Y77_09975, partial [Actinomycetota bacterium]|nr:hypothetical protein [Actinomycetota bacterium]